MAKTPTGKNTSGRGQRDLTIKVKTARGRKMSSTKWLQRQLNDPYVQRAQNEGYRGRAAFKIMELDDKFRFLVPGARVVDLGCAPGGWIQVAVPRINALGEKSGKARGRIIGVDLQEVDPVPGAEIHQLDFMEDDADEVVKEWLGGKADVVMSDMAPNTTGIKSVDQTRSAGLCERALEVACRMLRPEGRFCTKMFEGAETASYLKALRTVFGEVKIRRPASVRVGSKETYIVALDLDPQKAADYLVDLYRLTDADNRAGETR